MSVFILSLPFKSNAVPATLPAGLAAIRPPDPGAWPFRRRGALLLLLLAVVVVAAVAQSPGPSPAAADPHEIVSLQNYVVTASPLQRSQADLAQATSVLAGPALTLRKAATLGETLAGQPGVNSTWFGPGASRPVIRGLGGDRIRILENGVSTLDASVVSPDHAVSVEPFLVEGVEVVRGPASLLYGSSAVGGVVNVLTHRIERDPPEQVVSGRFEARGGTNADERAWGGVVNVAEGTGDDGTVVLHLDGFDRRSGDVEIPGFAESAAVRAEETEHAEEHGEAAPEFVRGRIPNTAVDSRGGALGVTWVARDAHVGLAWSGFDTRYGVPGHAHHGEEDGGAGDEGVRIDLRQRRLELQGETRREWGIFSGGRLRLARADYTHRELEGGAVGTVFDNDGWEGRAEVLHNDLGGMAGVWGVQGSRSDTAAAGDEAFLPPTRAENRALFAYEEFRTGRATVEFGGRLERQELAVRDGSGRGRGDTTASLSAGAVWNPAPGWTVAATVVRTGRAPNGQELYADGPHAGTGAYEIGDAALARERSLGFEVTLRKRTGRVTGELTLFANRFSGFIHELATGEVAVEGEDGFELVDPETLEEPEVEEALTVYRFGQADARFHGAEAEAVLHLHEAPQHRLDLRLAADFVRARDGAGRPLPRIPAARGTVGLEWSHGGWSAGAEWQATADQDRVAERESATGGYGLVSAHAAWRRESGRHGWEVFVRGSNLTDEEARPHTSFLKELAPLPGRSVVAGARWSF